MHRRAKLTVFGRRLLVERIEQEGWPIAHAAAMTGVSRQTATKWVRRYRAEGQSGPVGGPFAAMPRDLQDAAVDGVERARRSGQLNARDHHNAWVDFLLDRGWRHGDRDYAAKQHPALVYWPQLSPQDRDKARVFLSVVMGMTLDVETA